MQPPFELIDVSWPQPVQHSAGRWVSAPSWDAPRMNTMPRVQLRIVEGQVTWSMDWREFFGRDLRSYNLHHAPGEMRGFHLVFRLYICKTGILTFWDDDGCTIRRDGQIVHDDCTAHALTRHQLPVAEDDVLEISQWQLVGGWLWCGRILGPFESPEDPHDEFLHWLPGITAQLASPHGPALKVYTSGSHPMRLAAGVYSMILNGYTPAGVLLYGEEQWSPAARHTIATLLPFARIVNQQQLLQHVHALGGSPCAEIARRHWFVAKTFVALAAPPQEACMMDDDVFVLDPVTDALDAFSGCDLVHSPDQDLASGYLGLWQRLLPCRLPLKTGRFNAGLYWIRNIPPAKTIAVAALRCPAVPALAYLWEQGLIAMLYADRPTCELSPQRYAFPVIDGLPEGVGGYDYAHNPCGYTAIHFAGLTEKPSDSLALQVLSGIARRRANAPSLTASAT